MDIMDMCSAFVLNYFAIYHDSEIMLQFLFQDQVASRKKEGFLSTSRDELTKRVLN